MAFGFGLGKFGPLRWPWSKPRAETYSDFIPAPTEDFNGLILVHHPVVMRKAAELIEASSFQEARDLLGTIPYDPDAENWLRILQSPKYR